MMTEHRRHTTTGVLPGPFDIRIHRVCFPASSSVFFVSASLIEG